MKKLNYFYLILGLLFILVSCTKEDTKIEEKPKVKDFILCEDEGFKNDSTLDCGCDSEVDYSIDAENNNSTSFRLSEGILSEVDSIIFPEFSSYSYVIIFDDVEQTQQYFYFICNDRCISSLFESSPSKTELKVSFSGYVKNGCGLVSEFLEDHASSIILSKIAKID